LPARSTGCALWGRVYLSCRIYSQICDSDTTILLWTDTIYRSHVYPV